MISMANTVLVTGDNKDLIHALIRGFLLKEYKVITTVPFHKPGLNTGGTDDSSGDSNSKTVLNVEHNLRSPLSVRSLVLKTLNTFDSLDHAILVRSIGEENRVLHDLPIADIEKQIDIGIKGNVFLLKELVDYFWKHQQGTISIVLHIKRSNIFLPLDAIIHGALKELMESMFIQYKNEPIVITGFESHSSDFEDYAAFIIKTLNDRGEKSNGKWQKHSEKTGLFQNISIPGITKS